MKKTKTPVTLVPALVAICAIFYGLWHLYQREAAQEQHRESFSAPVPSGLPNFLNETPGAPPPQP